MPGVRDPLRIAMHVVPYVAFYFLLASLAGPLFLWLGGYLLGVTASLLFSAIFVNWLALRIFENRPLADAGLWWNHASADNLAFGLAGGSGAVCLALGPALAAGACHLETVSGQPFALGTLIFVALLLVAGAAGEELFFRGYGFQVLVASAGPWATVVPVGLVFALLHGNNPHANWFGIVNTAGFGILFGYAYLRSRDLWLPIGLHFGWNFTLLLFGVPISGLRMNVTGHEMVWSAGKWVSGGEYGPEASVLTSLVLAVLFAGIYKVPIRRQVSPLTDPPESARCEPLPPPSS
jgi:membrane protease YdiL (CAAX protease family)